MNYLNILFYVPSRVFELNYRFSSEDKSENNNESTWNFLKFHLKVSLQNYTIKV
jgi:hypothetical protein